MAEKKRIVWIDQLRGLAFYFVVLGHMIPESDFKVWIYSFHMPLFFVISGFNLNFDKMEKAKVKDYVAHLASRMLVPYLWLQLIGLGIKFLLYLFSRHREIKISGYMLGIIAGNSVIQSAASNAMYFVLLLFASQLIIFLLVKLTKGNKALVFAVAMALTAVTICTKEKSVVWHLNVAPTAMVFLFVGWFFMDFYKSHIKGFEKMKKPALIALYISICVILVALGALLSLQNGRASIHGNRFGQDYMIFVVSAALTSVGLTMLVMLIPATKLLSLIGRNTIFFLGIHEPFLNVVRAIFPEQWEKTGFVIIASVVCYFLPVPIAWLFNKVAPYICGMTSEKNDPVIGISKFFALALVLAVPYVRFTAVFLDGALRASTPMKLLSFVIFALVVVGLERLFTLLLPFFFLQNGKKKKVIKAKGKAEAEAINEPKAEIKAKVRVEPRPDSYNVFEDDDIMVIVPVEE